jgi:hypothetical protein
MLLRVHVTEDVHQRSAVDDGPRNNARSPLNVSAAAAAAAAPAAV